MEEKTMDILKRSLAPISETAWKEIDTQARMILHPLLSARRVIDLDGPKGWDYAAVPLGRLDTPKKQSVKGIEFGIHKVQPLIEARSFFELDIWELDNMTRGSLDVDLGPMEEAARLMARFEEQTIYDGFDPGQIQGMKRSSPHIPVIFSGGPEQILETATSCVTTMLTHSIDGPYALVVSSDLWRYLSSFTKGYPLAELLKKLLGGPVIVNAFMDDCYLLSLRGGDMTLILGQDLSIGYHSHDNRMVRLFFTESFTFRIADPSVVLRVEWQK